MAFSDYLPVTEKIELPELKRIGAKNASGESYWVRFSKIPAQGEGETQLDLATNMSGNLKQFQNNDLQVKMMVGAFTMIGTVLAIADWNLDQKNPLTGQDEIVPLNQHDYSDALAAFRKLPKADVDFITDELRKVRAEYSNPALANAKNSLSGNLPTTTSNQTNIVNFTPTKSIPESTQPAPIQNQATNPGETPALSVVPSWNPGETVTNVTNQ